MTESLNKRLDRVYLMVEEMMQKGHLSELSSLLRTMANTKPYDTDILIGFLTATLPVRTQVIGRDDVYWRVETVLKERGEWEPGILKGLE